MSISTLAQTCRVASIRRAPASDEVVLARGRSLAAKAVAALSLFLVPLPALAADYRSGFGFGFQLSDDWLVLTRPQVQKTFQNESQASLDLPSMDRSTFDQILQKVKSGQVEFVFDRRYSTKDWNNNISMQRMPARTEAPSLIAQASCPALAAHQQATLGSEVKVASCGVRTIADVSFVAYEYRIPAQDVSIVQFEIPFGFQGTLVLVGGSNDAGLANLRSAQAAIAEQAIRSLRVAATAASGPAR